MTAGFPSYEPYANSLVSTLGDEGISAEVVGCGLCGLTAVEMAKGLDAPELKDNFDRVGPGLSRLLKEQGPFDLVIIMAGTNDVACPSSVREVLASLKRMHAACWEAGVPTIALSVPESCVTGTDQFPEAQKKWHALNNALRAWGKAQRGELSLSRPLFMKSADFFSWDDEAWERGLWDEDGLHFTADGSEEFGSKLAPLLASHLQGPTGLREINDEYSDDESLSPRGRRMKNKGSMSPQKVLCSFWPMF
jgi:hypothetical protein